jgi:signal transduction histidine kinase
VIPNSLRFRLFSAASGVIVIALMFSGLGLVAVFERHVLRHTNGELDAEIEQIASFITGLSSTGVQISSTPSDPRFHQPFSGRYWQISSQIGPSLRSRSLWDSELAVKDPPKPDAGIRYYWLDGPNQQPLYAAVRTIVLQVKDETAAAGPRLLLIVALNAAEIEKLSALLRNDLWMALGLLAALLILASWLQVAIGLRPFRRLRVSLEQVRLGRLKRLSAEVPKELLPLVTETNRLLEAQELEIEKARARASDLAHGLKTPLTAVSILSQQLRLHGLEGLADEFAAHLRGLSGHLDRELARARIAADAGLRHSAYLAPLIARIVNTVNKLPRGNELDWRIDCADHIVVSLDEVDLAEVLGNLLDNARKWAKTVVVINARIVRHSVELSIEDDGSGIEPSERPNVLRRGKRLDERKPGSGLGLTIAKEVVEAYRGDIELCDSSLGGLAVRLRLGGQ